MSLEVTALTSYITVVTNQDETVTVTTQNPSPSQTAILFEDEGAALGTRGTVNELDFVGSGVTATRSGDKITVSVTSGGGGGTWGSITGTLSSQTDLQNELDKKILYLSAIGTNTYTAAYSLAAYSTGETFIVTFANTNTGAATLNVNSLGAISIVKANSSALVGNELLANKHYILSYDGTNLQLIGRHDLNERMVGTSLNRRHGPSGNANLGTLALSINVLRACPIYIPQRVTIDKLGFEITTGTSGKMWVALYNCNSDGSPNSLIAWSGEQTVTAPGIYEGLSVASVTVEPGTYWIAYNTDTGNTARSMASIASLYSIFMGMPSTVGSTFGTGWAVALTYTATAPGTFTGGGAISNAGFNLPFMFYRAI